MKTVTILPDSDLENPAEMEGAWTPYSFSRRHANFRSCKDLGFVTNGVLYRANNPGLRKKLEVGLAFVLGYYEHGNCVWFLHDDPPTGVEFEWDGVQVAGLLIWEHPAKKMGFKTYEDRRKDAKTFLETYTSWCNGEGYFYCVEDMKGELIDSCGGFYDMDYMLEEIAKNFDSGEIFEMRGDFEVRKELEAKINKVTPVCS